MRNLKTCSCGKQFHSIPEEADVRPEGFWWNCSCENTLFIHRKNVCDCKECVDDYTKASLKGECENTAEDFYSDLDGAQYYAMRASGRI